MNVKGLLDFKKLKRVVFFGSCVLCLFLFMFMSPNGLTVLGKINANFSENSVDADSNIDSKSNYGSNSSSFLSCQTKNGVYQNISETNQGSTNPNSNATIDFINQFVTSVSDSQSPTDLGTYSDWTKMQAIDSDYNNLTEEDAGGGLYFGTYSHRKNITINSDKVEGSSSHTNFTVLISLTDSDLRDDAQSNGNDITFYGGTTQLSHEIEQFNSTDGTLNAWVRIPSLSTSTNTTISMYYGNSTIGNQEDITGTWDNNYIGVWHLNGNFLDSTANNHDGTNEGSENVFGWIANGSDFEDGDGDRIYMSDQNDLSFNSTGSYDIPFTFTIWMKGENIIDDNPDHAFMGKYDTSGTDREYYFYLDNGDLMMYCYDSDAEYMYRKSNTNLFNSNGYWVFIAGVYSGNRSHTGISFYVNGSEVSSYSSGSTGSFDNMTNGNDDFELGSRNDALPFDGILDEAQFQKINRSEAWILTEFHNQNDTSTFYEVGSEENAGGSSNFRFDREFSFSSTIYNNSVERLCIKTGDIGAETLNVDVWYSSAWVNLGSITDSQDNQWVNFSISNYLVSANIYFRFEDNSKTSDITVNSWYIDGVLINSYTLQNATNFITVTIESDSNDDYWRYNDSSWTHITTSGEVEVRNRDSVGIEYGQFRWALPIKKSAKILTAQLFLYELSSSYSEAKIYRINETNVGPLESDTSKPFTENSTFSTIYFEDSPKWLNTSITELVQNQVNLADWEKGNYFGIQINLSYRYEISVSFEDYSYGPTNHAYIEISYIDSPGWLDGWKYRKFYLLDQNASCSANYSTSVIVYPSEGTDFSNAIHVGEKAQGDFGDIRFTSSDGETLLNYMYEGNLSQESTLYFNESVDFPAYPKNSPYGFYYNNRTYVVFQGDLNKTGHKLDAHIMYYDHENDSWSGIYYMGQNYAPIKETQDNHGPPALWVDKSGYIHVVYGSHNTPLKHTKSNNPEDLSSFTDQGYITNTRATYPHLAYDSVNDVVHIFYRRQDSPDSPIVYRNSSNNGQTWSSEQVIFDLDNYYAYIGHSHFQNGLFHIAWEMEDRTSYYDRDVHYAYLNVTSGILYNASGYNLGISLNNTEILTSCLVFDSGDNDVYIPNVHSDSNGNPYIFFSQSKSGSGSWTSFIYWNSTGSEWTSHVNVTSDSDDIADLGMDFIVHSSSNITAFLTTNKNMARWTWNGATWTNQGVLVYNTSGRLLTFSQVPINFNPELQVIFSEYREEQEVHTLAYAWGSGGILQRVIPLRAKFWVVIEKDLSSAKRGFFVYYGNSTVNSISTTVHTNASLVGFWTSEESSNINFRLKWEHQCQSVTLGKDHYTLTIYAFNSAGENVSVWLWNITSSNWIDSDYDISSGSTWTNISLDSFSGVIGVNITWEYRDNEYSPDQFINKLSIDYAGIASENDPESTTAKSPGGDSGGGDSGGGSSDSERSSRVFLLFPLFILILIIVYYSFSTGKVKL